MRQGLFWAVSGMAIGIAGAFAVGRVLAASLFGITGNDPPTLVVVVGILAGVSAVASMIPMRRATTVGSDCRTPA